jgi:hypothetical protein
MDINDPKITALRAKVTAAREEFDMAVAFHEAWKPAAYDNDLHVRMSASFASNTFLTVRMALRREVLLALMRLWGNDPRVVSMKFIANTLQDKRVINAFAAVAKMEVSGFSPPAASLSAQIGSLEIISIAQRDISADLVFVLM